VRIPITAGGDYESVCEQLAKMEARAETAEARLEELDGPEGALSGYVKLVLDLKRSVKRAKEVLETTRALSDQRRVRIEKLEEVARLTANINPFGSVENAHARDTARAVLGEAKPDVL
jgi:hypothetical protein